MLIRKLRTACFTASGRALLRVRLRRLRLSFKPSYHLRKAAIYKLSDGREFVFHRGDQLSHHIFEGRAYEPLETDIISRITDRGDAVVDIGANTGYYTSLLSKLTGPHGRVYSYEAAQKTFRRLSLTADLLHLENVQLHQLAVAESAGSVTIWTSSSGHDAQQSMCTENLPASEKLPENVTSISVDDIVGRAQKETHGPVAFIKCDIEGAEPLMLRGALQTLRLDSPPIWLIEHNRNALKGMGFGSSDIVQPFVDQGYSLFYIPLTWPPHLRIYSFAFYWTGDANSLPDECNLLMLPSRGVFADRAEAMLSSNMLESSGISK